MCRKARIEKDNKKNRSFIQSAFPATVSREESRAVVRFLEAVVG